MRSVGLSTWYNFDGAEVWPKVGGAVRRKALSVHLMAGVAFVAGLFGVCSLNPREVARSASPVWAQTGATAALTLPPVLLFSDDFATYSGRWREFSSAKATVAYRDEALHMRVVAPGVAVWSVPDFRAPLLDYQIAAQVRFNAGQRDGQVGLVTGYVDDEQFVAVLLTANGEVQVWQRERSEWHTLADITGKTALPLGREGRLQAELRSAAGSETLTVFINGVRIAEVQLPTGSNRGTFGLIAQAGRGYVDVSFDNVVVTALSSAEEE